jgi:hypothetical protein
MYCTHDSKHGPRYASVGGSACPRSVVPLPVHLPSYDRQSVTVSWLGMVPSGLCAASGEVAFVVCSLCQVRESEFNSFTLHHDLVTCICMLYYCLDWWRVAWCSCLCRLHVKPTMCASPTFSLICSKTSCFPNDIVRGNIAILTIS